MSHEQRKKGDASGFSHCPVPFTHAASTYSSDTSRVVRIPGEVHGTMNTVNIDQEVRT